MTGLCIWFTGNSDAGKTATLVKLVKIFEAHGKTPIVYDGTPYEEAYNLVNNEDELVIIARTSFYKDDRVKERERFDKYLEVYVDTPLEICQERDTKGAYAKGTEFPPYEPDCAEVVLYTSDATPQENAEIVYEYIKRL